MEEGDYMEKRINGLGIASLVFGILGILLICACGLGVVFGLIGVILGILGLTVMKDRGKGIAVAGTIVSGVALTFGLIWVGMYIWGGKSKPTDSLSNETVTVEDYSDYEPMTEEEMQQKMEELNQQLSEMKAELEEEQEELTEKEEQQEVDAKEDDDSEDNETEEEADEESDEVNPDLVAFLDSYEAYVEQYCEFCKNYDESDFTMLMEYAELMTKLADFAEQADKWENIDDLSNADAAYYTATMLRIDAKLLEAAAEMTK